MARPLPYPLSEVKRLGYRVFYGWKNLNLVVVRRGEVGTEPGNDTLYMLWQDRPDGPWNARLFACESCPGLAYLTNPVNPKGTAIIKPGQYSQAYTRGLHKGRPALVQIRPVTVYRDNDRDTDIELDPRTAESGLFAVNIHDVSAWGQLAGCIGLMHDDLQELLAVYDDMAAATGPLVTLTLLSE